MRYLLDILRHHWQNDFDGKRFIAVFLFASFLTYLNQVYGLIKPPILSLHHAWRIVPYLFLFGTVYIVSAFIACKNILHKKEFLLMVLICFGINAIDQSYILLWFIKIAAYHTEEMRDAIGNLSTHAVSIGSIIVPMLLFYRWGAKKFDIPGFFGLTLKKHASLKPYLLILAGMSVLIALSAYTKGISTYYPVVKRSTFVAYHFLFSISKPMATFIYEFIYASDFLSVELYFRGLLIFVFVRYLGNSVMLPMAACYMIYHFGKPVLETVSSFFGGYLLGILALHTRNIWGGVIVHMGVAMLMEFFAYIVSH